VAGEVHDGATVKVEEGEKGLEVRVENPPDA
jgi:hypothetical protein